MTYTRFYTHLRMWWRDRAAYRRRMSDGNSSPAAPVSASTVTAAVLEAARAHAVRHPGRRALIGSGREVGFSRFAVVVPAAAAGLARHGVRPGDVAAVHLADACDAALAVHAVTAAGAVPAPLPAHASAPELARLMNDSGARFLLTGSGEEAVLALVATERTYVRQVFAFGDLPGATPFARLVDEHEDPLPGPAGLDPLRDVALLVADPPEEFTHADRLADLYRLGAAAGIAEGDVVACCHWDCTPPTWLGLMDLCLTQGATFAGVPDRDPTALAEAIEAHGATLAVVTPEKLRGLAYATDPAAAVSDLRVLVTGPSDPDLVRACGTRLGWAVTFLA
jgi:acyl-coenzyme A synthetase/AMP-(fatty) acid ligase